MAKKSKRKVHRNPPRTKRRAAVRRNPPRAKARRRVRRNPPTTAHLCPCKGGCCTAAGVRCACRCHGRHHGKVRPNPPSEPKLHVHRFGGQPTALYYKRGGKTYEHAIGPGASILIPKRGNFIVIKGVRTGEYLEG